MSDDITRHVFIDNGAGRCYDCTQRPGGFWHTNLDLDEQIAALNKQFSDAESDALADYDSESFEGGGWVEIARAVCDMAGDEISPEAKDEWLRTQGISSSYAKQAQSGVPVPVLAAVLAAARMYDPVAAAPMRKSSLDAHPLFAGSPSQLAADRAWARSARDAR